jgi:hypothetical protein
MSVRIDTPSAPKPQASPPPVVAPVHDTMRRLQIGIAGVLTVLLLVGMAGLIGERARERAEAEAPATAEVKMPGEEPAVGAPLEELGVQPVSPSSSSSKDENAATSVKVPQAVAPAATVPDLEPDPELQRARQSKQ